MNSVKKLIRNGMIINEKNFDNNLYTKNIPHPDILIRTGDTKRLVIFTLAVSIFWNFFWKKLWPDFNESDYEKIIRKFKKIKRNFGKFDEKRIIK